MELSNDGRIYAGIAPGENGGKGKSERTRER